MTHAPSIDILGLDIKTGAAKDAPTGARGALNNHQTASASTYAVTQAAEVTASVVKVNTAKARVDKAGDARVMVDDRTFAPASGGDTEDAMGDLSFGELLERVRAQEELLRELVDHLLRHPSAVRTLVPAAPSAPSAPSGAAAPSGGSTGVGLYQVAAVYVLDPVDRKRIEGGFYFEPGGHRAFLLNQLAELDHLATLGQLHPVPPKTLAQNWRTHQIHSHLNRSLAHRWLAEMNKQQY